MRFRGIAAAATVVAAALAAAPAQAATTYPAGGSAFASGPDGWTGSGTACTLTVTLACTASNAHDPAAGSPAGSIRTSVQITLNLLGLFQGTGTWTSPAFTVPDSGAVAGATFSYDRRFEAGGLLSLSPQSDVTVSLVDQAAPGSPVTLLSETLGEMPAFATRSAAAPAGAVVPGHTYRLAIATETSSATAGIGLLGTAHTRFDDVGFAVDQSQPGGGGGGGGGGGNTPADVVTFRSLTVTDMQMRALFQRFDERTDTGSGPGGSVIPLELCTVVGTPRADRIRATSGNDVICGLGGNDVITGAGGMDLVDAARGADRIRGGARADVVLALAGADRVRGGSGRDRLGGGAGRDRIAARDGRRDAVDGGRGRDVAAVDRAGADRVRRVERLR